MRFRPKVIAFDTIETLFPLEPLGARLREAGLPAHSLGVWFARVLRDGMALDTAGTFRPFHDVAAAALGGMLAEHAINPPDGQVEQVLSAMGELPPHHDVRPALELPRAANVRALALTNGSADITRHMLRRAGLEHLVEQVISIDEVRHWKPARAVYLYAAQTARVEVNQLALVSAHAWDVQGAAKAGLTTAWLPRQEKRYSSAMPPPDIKAGSLPEAVERLLSLPFS